MDEAMCVRDCVCAFGEDEGACVCVGEGSERV